MGNNYRILIIYANGLIIQWLTCTATTATTNADFNLLVSFTSSYMAYLSLNSSTNSTESFEFRHLSVVTSNLSKVRLVRASTIPRFVLCIGY